MATRKHAMLHSVKEGAIDMESVFRAASHFKTDDEIRSMIWALKQQSSLVRMKEIISMAQDFCKLGSTVRFFSTRYKADFEGQIVGFTSTGFVIEYNDPDEKRYHRRATVAPRYISRAFKAAGCTLVAEKAPVVLRAREKLRQRQCRIGFTHFPE